MYSSIVWTRLTQIHRDCCFEQCDKMYEARTLNPQTEQNNSSAFGEGGGGALNYLLRTTLV